MDPDDLAVGVIYRLEGPNLSDTGILVEIKKTINSQLTWNTFKFDVNGHKLNLGAFKRFFYTNNDNPSFIDQNPGFYITESMREFSNRARNNDYQVHIYEYAGYTPGMKGGTRRHTKRKSQKRRKRPTRCRR